MTDLATRTMTILDETGDTTIGWDEDSEDKLLPIIQAKMDQGFIFYIIKPTVIPKLSRKVKAKTIEQVKEAGAVFIRDAALEELFQNGAIGIAKSSDNYETITKAKTANDVAEGHSVAVRVAKGG